MDSSSHMAVFACFLSCTDSAMFKAQIQFLVASHFGAIACKSTYEVSP